MKQADVLVIGAGIHGLMSAHALQKSGKKVVLLEQFQTEHESGSSHGETRIIRYAYDHADYIELVARAFGTWHELEHLTESKLLHPHPHLDLAQPNHAAFVQVLEALRQTKTTHEHLDSKDLAQRFPQFQLPTGYHGIIDPNAAVIYANLARRQMVRYLQHLKVEILAHHKVKRIHLAAQHVEIETDQGMFAAPELVLAAGAWTNHLLEPLGYRLPLEVWRTQSAFFEPTTLLKSQNFPIFFDHHSSVYGIPEQGQLKIGNRHREAVQLEQRSFAAIDSNLETLGQWIEQHLSGISSRATAVTTCLYTFTPDEDFIVDTLPNQRNVVIINACSGHGYKFAPLIGEMAADALLGLPTQTRFAYPRKLVAA